MKGRRKTRQGLVLTRKWAAGILACTAERPNVGFFILENISGENVQKEASSSISDRVRNLRLTGRTLKRYGRLRFQLCPSTHRRPLPGRLRVHDGPQGAARDHRQARWQTQTAPAHPGATLKGPRTHVNRADESIRADIR